MTFLNMFKVPDLRNKIVFTVFVIALYRFGSHIPVPGIDFRAVQSLTDAASKGGVLGFLNLFSGGALTRFAVFGLGIMPYITSSIIVQLLQVVIPKLEQWRDEGAVGQKKITQVTRYLTVALAVMQSTGLAFVFHNGGEGFLGSTAGDIDVLPNFTIPRVLLVVLSMTAETAMVMWLGELITQRGVGQGMSILIFANVVSGLPSQGAAIRAEAGNTKFAFVIAANDGAPCSNRVHRTGAATNTSPIRETNSWLPDVRRAVDLHPVEGQSVRRHPDHLCQLGAVLPGAVEQRHPVGWHTEVHQRPPR